MVGSCQIVVKLLKGSACPMLTLEGHMKMSCHKETKKHEKKEHKGKKPAPKKPTGMNSAIGQGFLQAMLEKKGLKA